LTAQQIDTLDAVAVVGAGAWGTSLACVLGERYREVTLWVYEADLAKNMARTRENAVYLPGGQLPQTVRPTSSLDEVVHGKELVIVVVPSHVFRGIIGRAVPALSAGVILVSATKGLEVTSLCTMSQIMREVLAPVHRPRLSVLSGPSFAREVVERRPTAVVAAADDPAIARRVQHALSGGPLRVYAGTDPLGVELGGAIKNVIAIAAGIVDGLALGTNARAALVTRGLAEMTRLGVAMGAEARTFAGLAGMGDLILTCTGDLSRNRTLGRKLAEGAQPAKLVAGSRTVAEGVNACRSVRRLAERHAVEMPICAAVHRVLFEAQDAREAAEQLMSRDLRFEGE
jgi:glycerol-3-phosphate dehydrogenase (NAD(P)+)